MKYAKLQIAGKLKLETGLHIGGGSGFAAIGATDSPVIKDAFDKNPIIPGSSIKGKMRSLLAKAYGNDGGIAGDDDKIQRLFGTTVGDKAKTARLIFSDIFVANAEDVKKHTDDRLTEVKFENTIDRKDATAKPRQIERVLRGVEFNLDFAYEIENGVDETEVKEDCETLKDGLELLTLDYLGGHGTRGYGRVSFTDITVKTSFGDVPEGLISELNGILSASDDANGE